MTQNRETQVFSIIGKVTDRDLSEIHRESLLVADLGLDSPTALLLLVELEDALGVVMSDTAAAKMRTAGDILDYLEAKV